MVARSPSNLDLRIGGTRTLRGTLHTVMIWLRPDKVALAGVPALAYFLLGFVLPLGLMVSISFGAPHWTLANYQTLGNAGLFWPLLDNTLRTTAIVTVVTLVLGYPYAYAMSRARTRVAVLLGAVMLFPFLVSTVVRSFTWVFILEPGGVVPKVLELIGIAHPPVLLGTELGVVIGLTQVELPFVVFPIFAALTAVKSDYLAAAASLGASPPRAFALVTVPLSMAGVAVGALLAIVYTLGSYITPELLGGQGSTMIGQGIALEVQTSLSWGIASTMGTVLFVVTALVLIASVRLGGQRLLGGR